MVSNLAFRARLAAGLALSVALAGCSLLHGSRQAAPPRRRRGGPARGPGAAAGDSNQTATEAAVAAADAPQPQASAAPAPMPQVKPTRR